MSALTDWAASVDGVLLDLDGAPQQAPYQCHDVWLSWLYTLGGRPGDGHAPGVDGWASEVWRWFPKHRSYLANLFTKHGPAEIRAGDVVFWSKYAGVGGLPHVAVALADADSSGLVYCMTQNPDATHREYLTRTGVLGVLRPITDPTEDPMTEAEMKRVAQLTAAAILDTKIAQKGDKTGGTTTLRKFLEWADHQWKRAKSA